MSTNAGLHITHTRIISLIIYYLLFILFYSTIPLNMSLQVGSTFPSIQTAKDTIKTVLAEAQESWKATHSDKTRFNIICKETTCNFRIRVTQSKRNGVCITHNIPHSCGPATHFTATNTHSLQFLIPHHRAAVIDNPKISAKQLQSNERL